jgi:hypothetical protein
MLLLGGMCRTVKDRLGVIPEAAELVKAGLWVL